MWLSHASVIVIVIALIIDFSGVQVSAEVAFSSSTNVKSDAVESSDDALKSPTGSLNSPPEQVTLPSEPLRSPTASVKLAERESGCRACQPDPTTPGDLLTCHIISGIFTKVKLSVGSHVVTTIPQHACRINITGSAIAYSHLVLTTASGDRILTGRRQIPHQRAAGTDFFLYTRPPPLLPTDLDPASSTEQEEPLSSTQYIVADGPIDEGISVKVVKEQEHGSTEILYTYTIPKRNQSTMTYHRARHHRNPRSTPLLKRYNSAPIRSLRKSGNRSLEGTSSKSVSRQIDTTVKAEKTFATRTSKDDAQLQDALGYLQTEPEELGHGRSLGFRKRISNTNPYPAVRPHGRFHQSAPPGSYDPRRKSPEVHGSLSAQPLFAPRHPVPMSDHQRPPRQSSVMEQPESAFPQPDTDLQPQEDAFQRPEISFSQEDIGFDKPETQFPRREVASTNPEVSEESQNDYDIHAETGYRDQPPISAHQGGEPQRPGVIPRTQQQPLHPAVNYIQSQGPGYAFYPARSRSEILEIPIYQRRESSDPGIVFHAQFYRNPFSPDIEGHSLNVYGPQPRWPLEPPPSLTHQGGFHPPRRPDGSAAAESRYVYQPQQPVPAPAQPLTAGLIRSRRLDAADDNVNRYGDDDEEEDDRYAWKIAGFTNCSRTCGGGTQSTMVVCVKMGASPVRVTDENCEGGTTKPTMTNVTCNNRPCQPSWEASDWSSCSTSCNLGQQVRQIDCRQRISGTVVVTVTAARCQHDAKPEAQRNCNADRPCYVWKTKEWSECSSVCGRGRRSREVTCVTSSDDGRSVDESNCVEGGDDRRRPVTVEDCQMEACSKSWYHSRWPTQCSSDCGDGVHSRRVLCGADDKKCNEKTKPPTTKDCSSEVPCGGTWFTSPWTQCSVSCGDGVKRRDVICVKKLDTLSVIVSDENCIGSDRVEEEEACSEGPCPPTWFTTDWSECSRTCNTGVQSREVKCLDDKERASQSCDPLDKPELKQQCNIQPCVPRNSRSNSQQLVVSCRDQLKTCHIVVQARLCRYNFYKESCCFSCSSHRFGGDDIVMTQTTTES